MKNFLRAVSNAWGAAGQFKAERDRALAERDQAIAERDRALAAAEAMRTERDFAYDERDRAVAAQEYNSACGEHVAPPGDTAPSPRARVSLNGQGDQAGKRALVVPLHGVIAGREILVTQPFFEAYCRRLDIDLYIVEVPQAIPRAFVKANLGAVIKDYERVALVEPHMIIREGCPDLFALVPEEAVGAVIEGRWTDRRERCTELSGLLGFRAPLPAERYINTDLLVMSRAHFPVLEMLGKAPLSGYRISAEDALNAVLYHSAIEVRGLPRDFNWVPYSCVEFDWRWAWVFNISGSWRSPQHEQHAWQAIGNEVTTHYSRVKLKPAHCRLPSLIETAEQLRGHDVRFVNPAEMNYNRLSARIHLTEEGAAAMWCGTSALNSRPPVYGPYCDLPAGRWSVSLRAPDGITPADPDIVADVAHDNGRHIARAPAPIGPQASFEIAFDRNASKVEIRLYSIDRDYIVGCVLFSALE